MKIALAMIVKGTNEEALLLNRCLGNMSPHVDGIFITSTHKKVEKPNEAVAKVAKQWDAELSEFEWVDDFAAARNFNFSQVPKEYDYIIWSDADDMWKGLSKLRPTIKENALVDAFAMLYLYDWDEWKKPTVVHQKTMVVKNDGCTTWVGELHEDLQPTRQTETYIVSGIERLHLTTTERSADNRERNLRIAQKQVKAEKDDPRSYWNLANSLIGTGKYKEANEAFDTFLLMTTSDEERYLAYLRVAEIRKLDGDRMGSIRQLQIAIGLYPELPDAYLQLGSTYYEFQNWDKAEEYTLQGLLRRPNLRKMIVHNPRDYDYNPMMMLAKIYYQKNRPDLMLPMLKGCLKIYPDDKHIQKLVREGTEEKDAMEKALIEVQKLQTITDKVKLKEALEKLPIDIASHPSVSVLRNRNFVKEKSSGKDIAFYCGNTVHQWNPELFKTKGFGGSEEAVVNLSRELGKRGWKVVVYNNCGHKVVTDAIGNVEYRPYWEYNYRDKQDVTIFWRTAKPLDADINSDKVLIDLHDVTSDSEFSESRLKRVTKIMVKTKFHRSLMPKVPDDKILVIPNGMDYALLETGEKKDPMLVINTSSPDRSLDVLPKLWKKVKAQVPDAHLTWVYGWDLFASSNADDPKKIQWMNDTIAAMNDAGIEQPGRITQAEVGKLYQKAAILAYPSEFAEIDCISVKKAQAAKCIPVTTDFGAFAESVKYGVKVHSNKTDKTWSKPYQFAFGLEDEKAQEEWVSATVKLLKGEGGINWTGLDAWKKQYDWGKVADQWEKAMQ